MKYLALLLSIISFHLSYTQTVQWATKLIDFSSEYIQSGIPFNSTRYKATQVLGVPNTTVYGVSELAWAPGKSQAGKEYVMVGFSQPQYVQQVIIGETYNPGAVSEIILYDEKGNSHSVYENKNTFIKNNFGQVLIPYKIAPTTYKVNRLKLILQTNSVGGMQQIDCIGISTNTAPVKLTINEILYSEAISNPENLGPNVNSAFFDHLPLISPDGSMLFFTRKFADQNIGAEQKDDIYYAYQLPGGNFSKAENIGPPLNNEEHNFVCYIGSDNKTLYLANKYKGSNLAGVSISGKQKDDSWSKPKALNIPNMYNDNEFVHYHLSLDEKTLLMCVQRADSYGDLDIYVSFKYADGNWSEPKNLGPTINTVGAEGSVFLAADGRTLYFSSTGHQGYGSYDMFMAKRLDNTWTNWSKPLNLGPKINSTEMDIYYTIPAAGDYAYYSSGRSYFGLNDLFRIKLPREARPEPVNITNYLANAPVKKDNVTPNASLDDKLNSLKNQQANKPIVNTPVANQPVQKTTTVQNKPALATTDDLEKKLEVLKQQQKQAGDPNATKPATTTTYKTEYVDPKPLEMPQQNKPDHSLKTFENIPKAENNDPAKKTFDNLAAQKYEPAPNTSPENPYNSAPAVQYESAGNPLESAEKSYNQKPVTASTPVSAPVPTSTTDPLQEKLEALKKQQLDSKNNIQTPDNTNNSNYSNYTQPTAYPNPKPVYEQQVNPQTDALQQKLYDVQPQPVYQTEGTKLPAQDPYEQAWNKPALKEKQDDKFAQEYGDMQDQINALKQQQQQQTFNGEAPKASKIKADTTNPAIKYSPPTTTATPVNTTPNPDILKYQEKLKQVQDKLAALNNIPETTSANTPVKPVDKEPAAQTSIPTNSPITPEIKTEPVANNDQQKALEALQEKQKIEAEQVNNTINSLNDSKNDLENNINDLTTQRDKINADKNKLSTENAQLAAEKAQLEADKKKMDELLAQMQAEKAKMENEKAKLDALKKQQEKEIFSLKSSIDSLKKIESQTADAVSKLPRYDLFNVPIEVGAVAVMSNIYFVADAAFIQSQSYPELDKLVAFMKQNQTLKVEIGGHTNGLCDHVFCNKLSNDRAKSVLDYLVKKGIDVSKLAYKGYGKQFLIAAPGEAINQRVEIKILSLQ